MNKTGEWTKIADLPMGEVRGMSSFEIDESIYLVSGLTKDFIRFSDLYSYQTEESKELQIYPNPTTNEAVFVAPFGTSFAIYDECGRQIYSKQIEENGYCILSNFTTGIYLIKSDIDVKGKSIKWEVITK